MLLILGSAAAADQGETDKVRADFAQFLPKYLQAIKERDAAYLAKVHPELPPEMTDFFFDMTQGMMRHAKQNGLQPEIECREYGVCTVTWPQPGDHWAAQTFIRHDGAWRWLAE